MATPQAPLPLACPMNRQKANTAMEKCARTKEKKNGWAKGKTSYLSKTEELCCTSKVVSVGQDDAGKT
jgi:hypothetical protein